jgi:hypothetical protein
MMQSVSEMVRVTHVDHRARAVVFLHTIQESHDLHVLLCMLAIEHRCSRGRRHILERANDPDVLAHLAEPLATGLYTLSFERGGADDDYAVRVHDGAACASQQYRSRDMEETLCGLRQPRNKRLAFTLYVPPVG